MSEAALQNAYEIMKDRVGIQTSQSEWFEVCLLYTSPSPRDVEESRMPSSA